MKRFPLWKLLSILVFVFSGTILNVFPVQEAQAAISWTQANTNGFGDANNAAIPALATFGSYIYAGTQKGAPGVSAELWRSSDGTTWTQANTDGFGDANNIGIAAIASFGGFLYAGTINIATSAELWRSSDGTTWTQANTDGFGDANNTSIVALATFGSYIYAGTAAGAPDVGAEIWRNTNVIPGVPSSLSSSVITTTAANLTWTVPSGSPTSYTISYGTDSSATNIGTTTSTSASKTLSGLSSNTTYYYKVRAINDTDDGPYSSVASFVTSPSAPASLAAITTTTTAALSWTALTGDGTITYTISYGTDSSATNIGTTTSTSASKTLSGLSSNTTYYYKIKATNTSGDGSYSLVASFITALSAPTALVSTPTTTTAALSWTAPTGNGAITSYTISVGVDTDATNIGILTSPSASKSLVSLTPNTTYYIKVKAMGTAGESAYTTPGLFVTLPVSPTNLQVSDATTTSVRLSWTAPSGTISSYTLAYGLTSSADTTTVAGITNTEALVANLISGTTYNFKILAVGSGGASSYSSAISEATLSEPPAPPANVIEPTESSETLEQVSATVRWSIVSGATRYQLSYGTDTFASNGGVIEVDATGNAVSSNTRVTSASVSYTFTDLIPGKKYFWKVASGNSVGYGDYSSPMDFITLPHASLGLFLSPAQTESTILRIVDIQGNEIRSISTFGLFKLQVDVKSGDINGDGWSEIAAGSVSTGGDIRFFDRDGVYMNHVQPFGSAYTSGVEYRLADVNGDDDMELIVIPRWGKSNLRVYNLDVAENAWELMSWAWAFGDSFAGGSILASGDTNGDGRAEIAVHPRVGSSNVQLYRVNSENELERVTWLRPYSASYKGGAQILLADFDGDAKAELITIPYSDGASQLRVYNLNNDTASLFVDTLVYAPAVHGGFNLAAGDVDGNGTWDIAVVPKAGNGSHLAVYTYDVKLGSRLQGEVSPLFDAGHRGGTNVIAHDVDGDGEAEVVVGSAIGAPNTRIYDFSTTTPALEMWFWAFDSAFRGGVGVSF